MSWRPPPVNPGHRWLARWRRWLIPAALFALTPKCLLCVLAYAGLGAALGFGGQEICGATDGGAVPWPGWLPPLGAAMVIGGFVARSARRH